MNINSFTLTISLWGRQVLWSPFHRENNIFWETESCPKSDSSRRREGVSAIVSLKASGRFSNEVFVIFFQKDVDKLKSKLHMDIYVCVNKDGFSDPKKENGSKDLDLAVREIHTSRK